MTYIQNVKQGFTLLNDLVSMQIWMDQMYECGQYIQSC